MSIAGTIFVVDDDKTTQALVAAQAARIGLACSAVDSAEAALAAVEKDEPALAIVAVELPGLNGLGLLHALHERFETLPIILTSSKYADPVGRAAGLMLGADDYLVKPLDPAELAARMRRSLRRSARPAGKDLPADPSLDTSDLSRREHEILLLLAEGRTQKQIATALVLSSTTVATHIQNTLRKLGVHSRTQAVVAAYRDGLVGTASARSVSRYSTRGGLASTTVRVSSPASSSSASRVASVPGGIGPIA
jgi:DNA-binding NarL/FixJ family response regulator